MRNLVGPGSCASIPIADFGKEFLLEPLARASAIIVDENDVGMYIDRAANLKAVVTNDVISINRKHKQPISYQFFGFMVQCLNDLPSIKDKSESFYRRQLFVPFTKCFTGIERVYIKSEYLRRPDVLRYVLKKVLVDMPAYYELSEPAASAYTLAEFKENNDPVRQFWAAFEDLLVWDLLPFTFLYDLYKAWYSQANPSGKVMNDRNFITALLPVVHTSQTFYCPDKNRKLHTGKKMSTPELLIVRYDLDHWKEPGYTGKDPRRMCIPLTSANYRGLLRYSPAGTSGQQDDDQTD
jgi:putative DNA primase/helicase